VRDRRGSTRRIVGGYRAWHMSPTWIWLQIAIVLFVLIGVVIAITKLA
jgi:hypothetical protein